MKNEDPKSDEQLHRAAQWTLMLASAGTHKDPNPTSPKARAGGNAHLRKPNHSFSRFKF